MLIVAKRLPTGINPNTEEPHTLDEQTVEIPRHPEVGLTVSWDSAGSYMCHTDTVRAAG